MTERSKKPQNPPEENEKPEVYSISQDKDGSFHFSRRNFLYFSAAVGGTLVLRGVCPRFGAKSAPSEPVQAGMNILPRVYVHTEPSIASNIADTLEHNDLVRLISDHPDLDWVEVATRNVQHGWVKRSLVDFSRAINSSSPDFDWSSTPPLTQTQPNHSFSVQLRGGAKNPSEVTGTGHALACGEIIQNGDFEAGSVSWVEESTGTIIRNDYYDPYQGSYVAWMGGPDAQEKLTQLIHVPADVLDTQVLEFYLKVTTQETGDQVVDTLDLHFLDGGGNTLTSVMITDNTKPINWTYFWVDLTGMTGLADQDMQIQFECVTDSPNDTSFVIDSVSLNLNCVPTPTPTPTPTQKVFYIYLPVIAKPPPPTSTPRPSATPCPNHNTCPTDCSSDCGYDCTYDCSSVCTLDCIYDCTFDCIFDCSYN